MKKAFVIMISIVLVCSSISAVTEYDIGGGQMLLLNDDGTYEIISSEVEFDRIVGKQYKLDIMRSIDPFIKLAMMEDPSYAFLGEEYYSAILKETGIMDMIATEIPDVSIVFLSEESILLIYEGNSPFETSYRISSAKKLYLTGNDGDEREIGTFSDDYEEIKLAIDDTLPLYLVKQN